MSTESDSVYEPYDPTQEFSYAAKNTTAVSDDPTASHHTYNNVYVQPVAKGTASAGTQPFPVYSLKPQDDECSVLSNVQTEFFRLDTRYLRSVEGLMRLASLVS